MGFVSLPLPVQRFSSVTNTTVSVPSGSAVLLLASNPLRTYFHLANVGSKSTSIQFTNVPVLVAGAGLPLPSGGVFGLTGDAVFTGDIYGISVSGTNSVVVTEGI